MFVIGVTGATGKLLVTSLFKGVGTREDAEPRRERNSTRAAQQRHKCRTWGKCSESSWEKIEMILVFRSNTVTCELNRTADFYSPIRDTSSRNDSQNFITAAIKSCSSCRVMSQFNPVEISTTN
jgi:hypothetical protein